MKFVKGSRELKPYKELEMSEKKAYDLDLLLEKLEGQGLSLAEDAAEKVYKSVREWAKESAVLSKNPYDDLAVPFFKQVDQIVNPLIDKIDGEKD